MLRSDPPRVCVAESIVDLDGGEDTWEEGRAQSVEEEVRIRQECEAKANENEPRTKVKLGNLTIQTGQFLDERQQLS